MKKFFLVGLISIGLVIVLGLISCGGVGNSPSNVVKRFHTAVEKDDQNALADLLTLETIQTLSPFYGKIKGVLAEYGKITRTKETIDGDTAIVVVTYENGEDKFNLVKRDGKWRIHQTK